MQNLAQLRRNPRIIFAGDVRVYTEREPRIAMPKSLLTHLEWGAKPVHQAAVGVPEGVSAPPNLETLLDKLVEKRLTQLLARGDAFLLEPEFQERHVEKAIRRLQSVPHARRWTIYYERFGCRECHRKNMEHSGNAYCPRCRQQIAHRLRTIERELAAEFAQKHGDDPIQQITGRVRAAERLLKGRSR